MDKNIASPLGSEENQDDTCILCGAVIPTHQPDCEYFQLEALAPESSSQEDGSLENLQAQLMEMERSSTPDFEAITELSMKIEQLKETLPEKTETTQQDDSFDEWAAGFNTNAIDLDQYGDGPAFQPPMSEPEPESDSTHEESKALTMTALADDVLTNAYVLLTEGGRLKLTVVVGKLLALQKILAERKKAGTLTAEDKDLPKIQFINKHLGKFKDTVREGFEKIFQEHNIATADRDEIIFDLLNQLSEHLGELDQKDPGALKILQNMLAREFLPKEQIKALQQVQGS